MTYTEVMKELAENPNGPKRKELVERLKKVDPMESSLPPELRSLVP
jgi:hypothetical protein